MLNWKYLRTFTLISLILIGACTNSINDSTVEATIDKEIDQENNNAGNEDNFKNVKIIFYDMTSPVELTNFIKGTDAPFEKSLLNPVDNKNLYTTNVKMALNLGVYGSDLVYLRSYNQNQLAIHYLAVIGDVCREIGIPDDVVKNTLGRADKNIEDQDSLFNIVKETYVKADAYFKESERESTAALVYFGSWVEALYLAANVYYKDSANKEKIRTHIAGQKFSLNNLLALLSNSYDNEVIFSYIAMINRLKKTYDEISISSRHGAELDTLSKSLSVDDVETTITEDQVAEIYKAIRRIRNDVVQ